MLLSAEQFVFLTRRAGVYTWFVSERDFWVLDHDAWKRAAASAGVKPFDPHHEQRFEIAVVDENSADRFLEKMTEFSVDVAQLRRARDVDGDLPYPALFVDFDQRVLHVGEVETPAFEEFLPPGWSAALDFDLNLVPENLRYWPLSQAG